jgi:hypothetical protein
MANDVIISVGGEMLLKNSVLSSRFGNAVGAPGLVSTQWKVNCPKKPWCGMIGLSRWSVVKRNRDALTLPLHHP